MSTRHRLSPHFVIEEFDCHDGSRVPESAIDDVSRVVEWWLEAFRAEFGPVSVLSGFRTPEHNREVGGAARSVHLLRTPLPGGVRSRARVGAPLLPQLAAAADVRASRGTVARWARWAEQRRAGHSHLASRGRGGIGQYPGQGFVHLDTGPLRDWRG